MRKKLFIIIVILISIICVFVFVRKENNVYTLAEIGSIALKEANQFYSDYEFLRISTMDKVGEKRSKLGLNGKREKWAVLLWSPSSGDSILYIIDKGKVIEKHLMEGKVNGMESFKLDEIIIDSPRMLKKSQTEFNLKPGENWAKGYHFILQKENDILFIIVVGDNSNNELTHIMYDSRTGELIDYSF